MTDESFGEFVFGYDAVARHFIDAGDELDFYADGFRITRPIEGKLRIVRLRWDETEGVVHFFAGAVVPRVSDDKQPLVAAEVTAINAELAIPGLSASGDSVNVHTYAFFNHDGSLSTRILESCLLAAATTAMTYEQRLAAIAKG